MQGACHGKLMEKVPELPALSLIGCLQAADSFNYMPCFMRVERKSELQLMGWAPTAEEKKRGLCTAIPFRACLCNRCFMFNGNLISLR